jgi:MbtH protein
MASNRRTPLHEIVVNDAREFAVWPSGRPLPPGWHHSGKSGPRDELLAHLRASFAPLVQLPVRK